MEYCHGDTDHTDSVEAEQRRKGGVMRRSLQDYLLNSFAVQCGNISKSLGRWYIVRDSPSLTAKRLAGVRRSRE